MGYKIQRENVTLTKYSRVCSVHLRMGRRGPNDVPTMFTWTPSTRAPPKPRECDDHLANACKKSKQCDLDSTIIDLVADNGGKTIGTNIQTMNATLTSELHTCDVAITPR